MTHTTHQTNKLITTPLHTKIDAVKLGYSELPGTIGFTSLAISVIRYNRLTNSKY